MGFMSVTTNITYPTTLDITVSSGIAIINKPSKTCFVAIINFEH